MRSCFVCCTCMSAYTHSQEIPVCTELCARGIPSPSHAIRKFFAPGAIAVRRRATSDDVGRKIVWMETVTHKITSSIEKSQRIASHRVNGNRPLNSRIIRNLIHNHTLHLIQRQARKSPPIMTRSHVLWRPRKLHAVIILSRDNLKLLWRHGLSLTAARRVDCVEWGRRRDRRKVDKSSREKRCQIWFVYYIHSTQHKYIENTGMS